MRLWEDIMSRKLLIPLIAAAFLAAPAFAPAPIAAGLSGSAHAVINLNSSRSNVNRMGGGPGKKAAPAKKTAPSAPPSKGQSTY
jgi:hypothetical protein